MKLFYTYCNEKNNIAVDSTNAAQNSQKYKKSSHNKNHYHKGDANFNQWKESLQLQLSRESNSQIQYSNKLKYTFNSLLTFF